MEQSNFVVVLMKGSEAVVISDIFNEKEKAIDYAWKTKSQDSCSIFVVELSSDVRYK